jgi:hypothetical protein
MPMRSCGAALRPRWTRFAEAAVLVSVARIAKMSAFEKRPITPERRTWAHC